MAISLTGNDGVRVSKYDRIWGYPRGQLKSEKGMKMLAVFLSCFETWRIRKQNVTV